MKNFVKAVAFTSLLILILIPFFRLLNWKESLGVQQFYQFDDDTMDVIFYGSSRCFCTVNPAVIWDENGIAAYNMGDMAQNLYETYYYMEESLKTQKPKVMAVEIACAARTDPGDTNGNLYRNTLGLKYSKTFFDNVNTAVSYTDQDSEYRNGIYLRFPVFHGRYDELSDIDYDGVNHLTGRYNYAFTSEKFERPKALADTKASSISEDNIKWLDKIKALADENGAELVFWIAPHGKLTEETQEIYNAAREYCKENDIAYLNFMDEDVDSGFDFATDIRDEAGAGSHVNVDGSNKISSYFAKYLKDNYDLEDRRGEEGYEDYDAISKYWERVLKNHELNECKDIKTYLGMLDDGYEYYIANNNKSAELSKITGDEYTDRTIITSQDTGDLWYMTDRLVLKKYGERAAECRLYYDNNYVEMNNADVVITTVDKYTGQYVETARFEYSKSKKDFVRVEEED